MNHRAGEDRDVARLHGDLVREEVADVRPRGDRADEETPDKIRRNKGSKGKWVLSKFYVCSCGKPSTPTRKGTYTVKDRGKYFNGVDKGDPYTCWYWTQYSGNYLYHSVVYKRGSATKILDGTLGKNVSHGCVRLAIDNAKWIYTNVPRGTKCVLY